MKEEKQTKKESKESKQAKLAKTWIAELDKADEYYKRYFNRCKNIIKYYRKDDRIKTNQTEENTDVSQRQFSIFWSNIQTLQPTIYSRIPVPVVERRYKDKDTLGRIASQLLERSTTFSITSDDFDSVMRQTRDDYLLCGRGISWVRYKPFFEQISVTLSSDTASTGKIQYTDNDGNCYDREDVEQGDNNQYFTENLLYEEAPVDFVSTTDFLTSPARTWEECRWVSRRLFLTRDECKARFDEEACKLIKFNYRDTGDKGEDQDGDEGKDTLHKKARIYEIWDKISRKVFWVCREVPDRVLDQEDDPLGLTNFFPCPKPLFATMTNDSLIPIPDFVFYQDQLAELDDIIQRRSILTSALKLVGIYDAEFTDLQDLASESSANILVPVENYRQIADKGGIKGMIDYVPLGEVISTIEVLDSRAQVIQNDIYNITGMSDIVRGSSNPNETATAQQIKGQFATLRLADRQAEFQRFAKDTIALVAEVIAEHFQPDTIKLMAGAENLIESNPQEAELIDPAIELLRNDVLRAFRVIIETDSTIAIDDQMNKEARNEFLQNVTPYMQNAIQMGMQAPEMLPVFKEMLMFMVRGLKAGRTLEGTIENGFDQMIYSQQQAQEQASQQPPQLTPEEMQMQAEQQKAQMDQQIKQVEMQFKQQEAQMKQQLEEFKAQSKVQLDQYKTQAEIELKTKTLEFETQLAAEKIRAEQAQKLFEFSNAQLSSSNETTRSANEKTKPPQVNIITSAEGAEILKAPPAPLPPRKKKKGFIKSMPDGSRYFEIDEQDNEEAIIEEIR